MPNTFKVFGILLLTSLRCGSRKRKSTNTALITKENNTPPVQHEFHNP